jgi:uracil-DNA glycosylase
MPVVVDGNNLLHSLPGGGRGRDEVRRRALETVRREGLQLTVVFDGPPPSGSPGVEHLGRVTVRYSGSATADEVILGLLPGGGAASQWVVVTDDRGLRLLARQRGANVRSLAQWRSRRRTPPRRAPREPRLSSHEIAEWEAFFAGRDHGEDS